MSASLLDELTGLITPDVLGKAASMLGESDAGLRKGLGGTLPALLSSVASRADDPGFASSLFELVRSPANDINALSDVGNLIGGNGASPMMNLGGKLLGLLFGGNTANITNTLAGYAGIKSSTASTLLNFSAPLVLGLLGKRARTDGLSASSLANLLRGQKDSLAAAVPAQLARTATYPGTPVKEREFYPAPVPRKEASIWRWLAPALVALVAVALLYPLIGRKETPVRPVAAVEPSRAPEFAAIAPGAGVPTAAVYFDVDQAALPANGETALAPVIRYLQTNSGKTAVISGYHDPAGDQATNEQLARSRADSVRATLVAAGIDESRIEMQKPVVTEGSGSPERARRVEVTVR